MSDDEYRWVKPISGSRAIAGLCSALALLAGLLVGNPGPAQAGVGTPTLTTPANEATVTANPELRWEAVADAFSYQVQVAVTDTFSPSIYTASVTGPQAMVPTDLPLGTIYWRIAAVDAAGGVGSFSPASVFDKTAAPAPVVLSPVSADPDADESDTVSVAFPADTPVLAWARVPGVKSYELQIATNDQFTSPTSVTTVGRSYVAKTAWTVGTLYYWRVRGISTTSGAAPTQWSGQHSYRLDWEASSPPVLISPADNEVTAQVELRWAPRSGVASYKLQISTSPDFIPVSTTDYGVNGSRYTPHNNFDATTRYWRVASVAADGSVSPYSARRTFARSWTGTDGLFARPNNVRAVGGDRVDPSPVLSASNVVFKWDPVPGAARYEVEVYEESEDANSLRLNCLEGNKGAALNCLTTHTELTPDMRGLQSPNDTSVRSSVRLADGKTYEVRVRGIDTTASGESVYSQWSDAARFVGDPAPGLLQVSLVADPREPTTSGEPASLIAPPDASEHQDTPTLSWQPVIGATGYAVYLATDSNFTTTVPTVEGQLCAVGSAPPCAVLTTNTSLRVPSQLPDNSAGQSYYWFVIPCSAGERNVYWSCYPTSAAINIADEYRSFRKVARAPIDPTTELLKLDPDREEGVRLSWTDTMAPPVDSGLTTPDGGTIQHFRLQISKDPEFTSNALTVLDTALDQPFYVPDIGLDPTTYHWRVAAVDGSESRLAWSDPQSFVHARDRAAKPIAVQAGTAPAPQLTWAPTTLAAHYQVEIRDAQSSATSTTVDYPAYTPTALLAAGAYTWQVRKVDNSGKVGPWESEASPGVPLAFRVGTDPPVLLTPATGETVARPDLAFRWSRPAGTAASQIEVSRTPDFTSLYETTITIGDSWAPTKSGGYVAGTYYWRVKALATASTGVLATSEGPAHSFTLITAPGVPTNLAVVAGTNQFSVSWSGPSSAGGSPITGWVVRHRASGQEWIDSPQDAGAGSVTFTDLEMSTTYNVAVAARNLVGLGAFTNAASVTTPGKPAAPGTLTVTPAVKGFHAVWGSAANGGSPITGYSVEYRPAHSEDDWLTVTAPRSPADVTGLLPDTVYDVRVNAVNSVGQGPYATSMEVTPYDSASAPTGLVVLATSGHIGLRWAAPIATGGVDVGQYRVEIRANVDGAWTGWSSAKVGSTTRTYDFLRLTNGRVYQVQVYAVTSRGNGTPAGPVTAVPAGYPGVVPTISAAPGRRKVKVSWTAAAANGNAIRKYVVQVASPGKAWRTLISVNGRTTSTTWTKAKRKVTYTFRIFAVNGLGPGPISETAVTTARALIIQPQPQPQPQVPRQGPTAATVATP